MAGTRAGGIKTAIKNLEKDPDFYKKIGAIGGRNGNTGGFAANPELARIAGAKGGKISKRKKEGSDLTILETMHLERQDVTPVKHQQSLKERLMDFIK